MIRNGKFSKTSRESYNGDFDLVRICTLKSWSQLVYVTALSTTKRNDSSCSDLFESYESAFPQEVSLVLSVWKKTLKDLSLDASESVDLSVDKLSRSLFNSRRKSAKHL